MGQFKDYMDLDEHPFTGLRKLSMPFKARIKNTEYIRKFFDGTPNFSQVEDVTIGKVYEIHGKRRKGQRWVCSECEHHKPQGIKPV